MTKVKNYLKILVNVNNCGASYIFDICIQILIVLNIIAFSVETIPTLTEEVKSLLFLFEVFSVIIFSLEYLIRIWVAESKLSYIFSFYGLIDFLVILPFYLALAIDLRVIKSLQFFRLFRLLKLTRYSKTMGKFQKAIYQAREEFILFFMLTIILFYLASVGIYFFENDAQPKVFTSIFDSMWWAVATLTTVGYGDVYPITVGGKIFTAIILLIGLGVVGIPAGIVSSALTEVSNKEREENSLELNI
jgi:voltage-gated potassium channel